MAISPTTLLSLVAKPPSSAESIPAVQALQKDTALIQALSQRIQEQATLIEQLKKSPPSPHKINYLLAGGITVILAGLVAWQILAPPVPVFKTMPLSMDPMPQAACDAGLNDLGEQLLSLAQNLSSQLALLKTTYTG